MLSYAQLRGYLSLLFERGHAFANCALFLRSVSRYLYGIDKLQVVELLGLFPVQEERLEVLEILKGALDQTEERVVQHLTETCFSGYLRRREIFQRVRSGLFPQNQIFGNLARSSRVLFILPDTKNTLQSSGTFLKRRLDLLVQQLELTLMTQSGAGFYFNVVLYGRSYVNLEKFHFPPDKEKIFEILFQKIIISFFEKKI